MILYQSNYFSGLTIFRIFKKHAWENLTKAIALKKHNVGNQRRGSQECEHKNIPIHLAYAKPDQITMKLSYTDLY